MHLPFLEALARGIPDDGILVADSTQPAYAAHNCLAGPLSRAATSRPAASARSAPRCRWRSARSSPRPVVRSRAWPATAAPCSRIQELASAADLGLPIALVIWQNDGYGEMRDSMDRIGVPHVGTEISARDFVRLAEGFGCRGVRTGSLDELPDAPWRRPSPPTGRP